MQGTKVRMTPGESVKTVSNSSAARKPNCKPRILCPANTSFKNKGEIKVFLHIEKLKELITSRSALQKMLRDIIQAKGNDTRWKSGSTQRIKST